MKQTNGNAKQTEAAQRRRPFTVKTGHSTTYIYCTNHAEEIATFYCQLCRKPFGEDCVGKENGEHTVCSNCANAHREKRKLSLQRQRRIKRVVRSALALVLLAILGTNGYILLRYSPDSGPASEPALSTQLSQLINCRHRLEFAAFQAAYFTSQLGHPPADMDDLAIMMDSREQLQDPVTHSDFLIVYDADKGLRIICPHPEAYGLRSLLAEPRKPAHMEYL